MTRAAMDQQIHTLQEHAIEMAGLVEVAIDRSSKALRQHDMPAAAAVLEGEDVINRRRYEIDQECIALLATQQPVATDLRVIVAVLNTVVELERIGDHAVGNAKLGMLLAAPIDEQEFHEFDRMTETAATMLRDAANAFRNLDVDWARSIARRDQTLDRIDSDIRQRLIVGMQSDHSLIERNTHLLAAVHNYERMADRVTNICEWIVYAATGQMEELNSDHYIDQ